MVHCKVRLFMTKMYWSTFDLDHYKRTRHWSSFKKRSFDSDPNPDCDATGREGENRDDDLRLVDQVRCCRKQRRPLDDWSAFNRLSQAPEGQ